MAEIVWTQEAVQCLEEIRDYIATDSPGAAQNVVQGIYQKLRWTFSVISPEGRAAR